MTFDINYRYAQDHLWEIENILREICGAMVSFKDISGTDADLYGLGDMQLLVKSQKLSLRVRRPRYFHKQDFSLRAWVQGAIETEIDKVQRGVGRYFFYAWCGAGDKIQQWILVDLNQLRLTGWLNDRSRIIPNKDGRTAGWYCHRSELQMAGCIVRPTPNWFDDGGDSAPSAAPAPGKPLQPPLFGGVGQFPH